MGVVCVGHECIGYGRGGGGRGGDVRGERRCKGSRRCKVIQIQIQIFIYHSISVQSRP